MVSSSFMTFQILCWFFFDEIDNVPNNNTGTGWMPLLSKGDFECNDLPHYDVYLGGDSSPSGNWRSENAIPLLRYFIWKEF
jgi:hypothetical protein